MQKLVALLYPIILLLLFTLLFFFGLKDPVVIDYDEGVYAEVSRSMYLNEELVIPELNGNDFFEKPPMLFWAQMLGYKLFGISSFGARFFNTLSGLATLLIFYFGAQRPLGSRTAFNATLILGSSIIFVYLSRVAMTDMLLTMFLTGCLIVSYQGVERALQDRGGSLWFWAGCLCAGLAMLSKGAIGALFPLITAVVYLISIGRPTIIFRKNWFFPGSAIIILVGFSWYLLLGFIHPEGFGFMKELFMEHHIGRFSGAMEGHSGPLFYYLIILLVGFMPWFSYLPLAIMHAPIRSSKDPAARFIRLFVIFSLSVFLFFSLAATKLPNYILPVLPGFSLMLACLFNRTEIKHPLFWQVAGYLSAILALLLGLIIAAVPFVFPYLPDLLGEDARKAPALAENIDFGYSLWLAALLFVACSLYLVRTIRRNDIAKLFEALLISSFIFSASLFYLVIPQYDRIFDAPLSRLATLAAASSPDGEKIMVYELDDRPSINFASGRQTISHNERDYLQLPQHFKQSGASLGLTTSYYFERLINRNVGVIEISRDTGFVLFRLHPEQSIFSEKPALNEEALPAPAE
jgi:4-amino-4-deoxy-L-arabinose transferase-like glycosyltransferase